jgi:hypothetical protein
MDLLLRTMTSEVDVRNGILAPETRRSGFGQDAPRPLAPVLAIADGGIASKADVRRKTLSPIPRNVLLSDW